MTCTTHTPYEGRCLVCDAELLPLTKQAAMAEAIRAACGGVSTQFALYRTPNRRLVAGAIPYLADLAIHLRANSLPVHGDQACRAVERAVAFLRPLNARWDATSPAGRKQALAWMESALRDARHHAAEWRRDLERQQDIQSAADQRARD